jgi:hypothetical protein
VVHNDELEAGLEALDGCDDREHGEVLDERGCAPAARVAQDHRLPEIQPKHISGIDAMIGAREYERSQVRAYRERSFAEVVAAFCIALKARLRRGHGGSPVQ